MKKTFIYKVVFILEEKGKDSVTEKIVNTEFALDMKRIHHEDYIEDQFEKVEEKAKLSLTKDEIERIVDIDNNDITEKESGKNIYNIEEIRHNIPYHKLMDKIYKHVGSQSKYERWDWDELEGVYCSILYHIRLNFKRKKEHCG